ncbi:MAG: TolB family protein [Clostridia bacterium]|nr:TolB family protein [Clostridia bacterium]
MAYNKYSEYLADRAQKSILQIFDLATREITVVKRFNRVIEAPNWTRDGKHLIVNGDGQIFRVCIETGAVEKIETGPANTCNNDHVLNPDGTGIAVSSGRDDDMGSRIYIVDFASGDVRCAVDDDLSYLHGWSPDGRTLAYCAGRNIDGAQEWDIYTRPVAGGAETRLTDAPGLNDGPEFSPDGRQIWFNSVRTSAMQAYVMNADGSDQRQMTFDADFYAWFPHISPDMEKVVYVAYRAGDLQPGEHLPDKHVEIRMIPATGGAPETLVRLFGGQGTMNVNSWSPDSTKFAFVSYEY